MFNQQLRKRRLTNTPTDASQVRCNCGLSLNSPKGRGSVADLKTFLNNENLQVKGVPERTAKALIRCKNSQIFKMVAL
jgi:hypothetical protein